MSLIIYNCGKAKSTLNSINIFFNILLSNYQQNKNNKHIIEQKEGKRNFMKLTII